MAGGSALSRMAPSRCTKRQPHALQYTECEADGPLFVWMEPICSSFVPHIMFL